LTGRKTFLWKEDKMELKGKKVIILLEQLFNDNEFWYPYYRLKEAGAQVVVVGTGTAPEYTGKSGTKATVDMTSRDILASQFDGVIIPGGYAPDHMRRDKYMVRLVRDLFNSGKVVAAICHAGWMLASAEIVTNRTVTSYDAIKDDLIHAGANWVDQEVVVDGNLITSRKPDDLPAFMRTFIAKITGS
jgi:protease I